MEINFFIADQKDDARFISRMDSFSRTCTIVDFADTYCKT